MTRWGLMACIVVLLGWHSRAVGQPTTEEATSSATNSESTAAGEAPAELEPLTVTGARTRLAVQREMYAVQDQAYALFNELNTEDDYDIICRTERPWGSQFTHRVCQARFEREARSRAALEFLQALEADGGVYHVNRQEIDRKYEHNKELMANLANTHPEFRELLEKQYALRQEFEAKGGKVRYGIGGN